MKRNLLILLTALLCCSFTGCGSETVVAVNVENEEDLHSTTFGKSAFVEIGNDLYYDSATRIVWLKNKNSYGNVYIPYYAPNGLPYRYNPETNTFEEIEVKLYE